MAIVEKLSGLYSFLEEKYYGLLDFLDEKGVPVYAYADFFENKGIPSFPLTVALLVIVIALLAGFFVVGATINPELQLSISDQFNDSLSGVQLNITDSSGRLLKQATVSNGSNLLLENVSVGAKISLEFKKEGYETAKYDLQARSQSIPISVKLQKQVSLIEAMLKLVDAETGDTITNAEIILTVQNQTRSGEIDEKGIWKFNAVPENDDVRLQATATAYEVLDEHFKFSKGEIKQVSLHPKVSSFSGETSKLLITVKDTEGSIVKGAKILLKNRKQNDDTLAEGIAVEGEFLAELPLGTSTRLIVEKDGFARYDCAVTENCRTMRETEEQWSVVLSKGGAKLRVTVKDELQNNLDNAFVGIYSLNSELIVSSNTGIGGTADFFNLDPSQELFVTGYLDGYLPARKKISPATETEALLVLESANFSNSAGIAVYVAKANGTIANNVPLKFFEKQDDKLLPAGIPDTRTDVSGFASARAKIGTEILVKAETETEEGQNSATILGNQLNEIRIQMEKKSQLVEFELFDENGKPFVGKVRITTPDGKLLLEENVSDGKALVDAAGNEYLNVELDDGKGKKHSEQVRVKDRDSITIRMGQQQSSGIEPTIELARIVDERGKEVQGITPDKDYWLEFNVSFPSGTPKGGIHVRIGNDETKFADSEEAGVTGFDAVASSSFFGRSYQPLPSPGNESADRMNAGKPGQQNKFLELYFDNPSGSHNARVKVRARSTIQSSKIIVNYRAWSEISGQYYRQPSDTILGNKKFSEKRLSLYASSFAKEIELFDNVPECENGYCVSFRFFDAVTGLAFSPQGFSAITDSLYALEIGIRPQVPSQKAVLKVSTPAEEQKISFNGFEAVPFREQLPTEVPAPSGYLGEQATESTPAINQGYIPNKPPVEESEKDNLSEEQKIAVASFQPETEQLTSQENSSAKLQPQAQGTISSGFIPNTPGENIFALQQSQNPLGFNEGQTSVLKQSIEVPSVALEKGEQANVRIDFRTLGKTGIATIRVQITAGETVINKELKFRIARKKEMLLKIVPEEVELGQAFSVQATELETGKGIENALVQILGTQKQVLASKTGNATEGNGKQGVYNFQNNLELGEYLATAKAEGYAEKQAVFLVRKKGVLKIKEEIKIDLRQGEKTKTVNAILSNTSDKEVSNLSYSLNDGQGFPEQFLLRVTVPDRIQANSSENVSFTLEVDDSELGRQDSLFGTIGVDFSGQLLGKYPVIATTKALASYNKKIDAACLSFNKPSLRITMNGNENPELYNNQYGSYPYGYSGAGTSSGYLYNQVYNPQQQYPYSNNYFNQAPYNQYSSDTQQYYNQYLQPGQDFFEIKNDCGIDLTLNPRVVRKSIDPNIFVTVRPITSVQNYSGFGSPSLGNQSIFVKDGETVTVAVSASNSINRLYDLSGQFFFEISMEARETAKSIPLVVELFNPRFFLQYPQSLVFYLRSQGAIAGLPAVFSGEEKETQSASLQEKEKAGSQKESKNKTAVAASFQQEQKISSNGIAFFQFFDPNKPPPVQDTIQGQKKENLTSSGFVDGSGKLVSTEFTQGARDVKPLLIANIGSVPITGFGIAIDDQGYRQFGITAQIEPPVFGALTVYPGQGLAPNRFVVAETRKNDALQQPAGGQITYFGTVQGRRYYLGQTAIAFNYAGQDCLVAEPIDELFFQQQSVGTGAGIAKRIKITNKCAVPVNISGLDLKEFRGNPIALVAPTQGATIPAGAASPDFQIQLVSRQAAKGEARARIVGILSGLQQEVKSNELGLNISLGSESKPSETGEAKGIPVEVDVCEQPKGTKMTAVMPKFSSQCNQGYCDAVEFSGFLLGKISAFVKEAQAKAKNASCPKTREYCTFREVGAVPPSSFTMYQSLDFSSQELLQQKATAAKFGAGTIRPQTATEGIEKIAETGFAPGDIFVPQQLAGCGEYQLSLDGAFRTINGEVQEEAWVVIVKPLQERKQTQGCEEKVWNIMNFLPIDKSLTASDYPNAWPGIVSTDSGTQGAAEEIAREVFAGEKGRTSQRQNANMIKLIIGDTKDALVRIRIQQENSSGDRPRTVFVHLPSFYSETGTATAEGVEKEKINLQPHAEKLFLHEGEEHNEKENQGTGEENPTNIVETIVVDSAPVSGSKSKSIATEAAKAISGLRNNIINGCITQDGLEIRINELRNGQILGSLEIDPRSASEIKINAGEQCADFIVNSSIAESVAIQTDFSQKQSRGSIDSIAIKDKKQEKISYLKEQANASNSGINQVALEKQGVKYTKELQFCVNGSESFAVAPAEIQSIKLSAKSLKIANRQTEQHEIKVLVCGIHPYKLQEELANAKPGVYYATVGWDGQPEEIGIDQMRLMMAAAFEASDKTNSPEQTALQNEKNAKAAGKPAVPSPTVAGQKSFEDAKDSHILWGIWTGYFPACAVVAGAYGAWQFGWGALVNIAFDCFIPAVSASWNHVAVGKSISDAVGPEISKIVRATSFGLSDTFGFTTPKGVSGTATGEATAGQLLTEEQLQDVSFWNDFMTPIGMTSPFVDEIVRAGKYSTATITPGTAKLASEDLAELTANYIEQTVLKKAHPDFREKIAAEIKAKLARHINSYLNLKATQSKTPIKISAVQREALEKSWEFTAMDIAPLVAEGLQDTGTGFTKTLAGQKTFAGRNRLIEELLPESLADNASKNLPTTTGNTFHLEDTADIRRALEPEGHDIVKRAREKAIQNLDDAMRGKLGINPETNLHYWDDPWFANTKTKIRDLVRAEIEKETALDNYTPVRGAQIRAPLQRVTISGKTVNEPGIWEYSVRLSDSAEKKISDAAAKAIKMAQAQSDIQEGIVKNVIGIKLSDEFGKTVQSDLDNILDPKTIKSLERGTSFTRTKDWIKKNIFNRNFLTSLGKGLAGSLLANIAGLYGWTVYNKAYPFDPDVKQLQEVKQTEQAEDAVVENEDPTDNVDNDRDGLVDEGQTGIVAAGKLKKFETYRFVVTKGAGKNTFERVKTDKDFERMRKELKEKKAVLLEEDCEEFAKTGVTQLLGSLAPNYEDSDPVVVKPFIPAYYKNSPEFAEMQKKYSVPEPLLVSLMTYSPETIKDCRVSGALSEATTREEIECVSQKAGIAYTASGKNAKEAIKSLSTAKSDSEKENYAAEIIKRANIWNNVKKIWEAS